MAMRTSLKGTELERLFACLSAISLCARGSDSEFLSVGETLHGGERETGRDGGEGMIS